MKMMVDNVSTQTGIGLGLGLGGSGAIIYGAHQSEVLIAAKANVKTAQKVAQMTGLPSDVERGFQMIDKVRTTRIRMGASLGMGIAASLAGAALYLHSELHL